MNYEERRQMFHGNHDDEGTKENTTEQDDK